MELQESLNKSQSTDRWGSAGTTGVSAYRQCPRCGYMVEDGDRFCENCGYAFSQEAEKVEDGSSEIREIQEEHIGMQETKEQPVHDEPVKIVKPDKKSRAKAIKTKSPTFDALVQRAHSQNVKTDLPKLGMKEIITKERIGWVCNLCGCIHSRPEECAQPELGGVWKTRDVKEVVIEKV